MTRINVVEDGVLVGWFDQEKAEEYTEGCRWDGNNNISLATGTQWDHEVLYRTAGGRWVLHSWSQWQGSIPTFEFVGDTAAREWLLRNERDEDAERLFGQIEPERGPGRPEIGPATLVRLPEKMIAALDRRAEKEGVSRAEVIRQMIGDSL